VLKIALLTTLKKATGADGIPAKIIKCSKSIIAPQITSILNMSIDQTTYWFFSRAFRQSSNNLSKVV
jgi:hypothetical protein